MDTAEKMRQRLRKAIAQKIRQKGLSQSQAGELVGMRRTHINQLLNETEPVALKKMILVAEGLGLKVKLVIEDPGKEK